MSLKIISGGIISIGLPFVIFLIVFTFNIDLYLMSGKYRCYYYIVDGLDFEWEVLLSLLEPLDDYLVFLWLVLALGNKEF